MNKKILLVEDDPAILLGLEDYLLAQNFDVIKAENGKVGHDLALKENPDLILLDINLPSIDGFQNAKRTRI